MSLAASTQAQGTGHPACDMPGLTQMLAARKGDVAVSVRAQAATRDQLIALVRMALERIR